MKKVCTFPYRIMLAELPFPGIKHGEEADRSQLERQVKSTNASHLNLLHTFHHFVLSQRTCALSACLLRSAPTPSQFMSVYSDGLISGSRF